MKIINDVKYIFTMKEKGDNHDDKDKNHINTQANKLLSTIARPSPLQPRVLIYADEKTLFAAARIRKERREKKQRAWKFEV